MFLTEAANRGSISTGYEIDNSAVFDSSAGAAGGTYDYLYYNPSSTSNRKTATLSCWVKRSSDSNTNVIFAAGQNQQHLRFQPILNWRNYNNSGSINTAASYRDIAAWYHVVMVLDTGNSTAASRNIIYVNGVATERESSTDATQNDDYNFNYDSSRMYIGCRAWYQATETIIQGFDGYIAELHWIDGAAKSPTDFGEFDEDSGIWKPIKYDGTYGTNGAYLKFNNASNLGADSSGNGNNWTPVGLTSASQATDTPTNNFCTLNPIAYNTTYTATEGNTKWSKSDTTYGMASGTHYVGAGKWYWEVKATDFNTYSSCQFGILDAAKPTLGPSENGYEDPSLSADNAEILVMSGAPNNWNMNSNSTISNNGSTNSVDYTFNEGDIIAIALDMDNGGYWFGNSRYSGVANGSFWVAPGGTSTSGSVATTDPSNGNYALVGDGGGTNNGTPNFNGGSINGGSLLTAGFTLVTPTIGAYHSNTTVTLEVNFGGFTSYAEDGGYADANGHGNFAYAVPSGFYSLCSKNIAEFGGSG